MSHKHRLTLLLVCNDSEQGERALASLTHSELDTSPILCTKLADAEQHLSQTTIDAIICSSDFKHQTALLKRCLNQHHTIPFIAADESKEELPASLRAEWIEKGAHDLIYFHDTRLLSAVIKRETQRHQQQTTNNILRKELFENERQSAQLVKHSHIPSCGLIDGIPVICNNAFATLWPNIDQQTLMTTPFLDIIDKENQAELKKLLSLSQNKKQTAEIDQLLLKDKRILKASLSPFTLNGEAATLLQCSALSHEIRPQQNNNDIISQIQNSTGTATSLFYIHIKQTPNKQLNPEAINLLYQQLISSLRSDDTAFTIKDKDLVIIRPRSKNNQKIGDETLLKEGADITNTLLKLASKSSDINQAACGICDLHDRSSSAKQTLVETFSAANLAIQTNKSSLLTDRPEKNTPRKQWTIFIVEAIKSKRLNTQLRPIVNLAGDARQRFLLQLNATDEADENYSHNQLTRGIKTAKLENTLDRWLIFSALNTLNRARKHNAAISLFIPTSDKIADDTELLSRLKKALKSPLPNSKQLVIRCDLKAAKQAPEKWIAFINHTRELKCAIMLDNCSATNSELSLINQIKPDYTMLSPEILDQLQSDKANETIETIKQLNNTNKGYLMATQVNDSATLAALWNLGIDLLIGDIIDKNDKNFSIRAMAS